MKDAIESLNEAAPGEVVEETVEPTQAVITGEKEIVKEGNLKVPGQYRLLLLFKKNPFPP